MKRKGFIAAISFCLLILILPGAARSQAPPSNQISRREVAVTFDDLPAVLLRQDDTATAIAITAKLLEGIKSNEVPAIGFVNDNKLLSGGRSDPARVALLQKWLDAGLELGNHTFSHIDLHTTPLATYEEDLIRGEAITGGLLQKRGMKLRYFRHPFLHTGRDLETRREFEHFLAGRGYRVAPVTIDNSDWIFARAYDKAAAAGDGRMMRRIAEAYVPYMEQKFEYFERNSVGLFGREIKQVLLIHANALNAAYFNDLARMMKRRGYQFITLDRALTDKAYESADIYTGAGGITWLHRWAITKGMKSTFYQGESATPAFVMKQAGVTAE